VKYEAVLGQIQRDFGPEKNRGPGGSRPLNLRAKKRDLLMRKALTDIDPNAPQEPSFKPIKPRGRAQSDASSRLTHPDEPIDDEIWNLTQRVAHLESALDQTRAANSAIYAELTRLGSVESDLSQQQAFNAPLVDAYLQAIHDEENRLFQKQRDGD
jgi:hypothetical protein